ERRAQAPHRRRAEVAIGRRAEAPHRRRTETAIGWWAEGPRERRSTRPLRTAAHQAEGIAEWSRPTRARRQEAHVTEHRRAQPDAQQHRLPEAEVPPTGGVRGGADPAGPS